MEILRVEYRNVYGNLSGELNFSRGENFLVGINGCGKTTVLNLIRWILGPSFPDLFTLQHDLIKVDVRQGRYQYSIQSRIDKNKYELKVVARDKSRKFNPITATLVSTPQEIKRDLIAIKRHYETVSPEEKEISTWNFLARELPSTVFIGLERSIPEVSHDERLTARRYAARIREETTPLKTATNLMRDAFNTSTRRLIEINEKINRRVLELSFSGVIRNKLSIKPHSPMDILKKIKILKDRFENPSDDFAFSKALSSTEVSTAIVKFLNDLTSLSIAETKEDKIWVMLNQHNFNRAAKMFDLFVEQESRAKEAQREITAFSNAVNSFLGDSGKSIHFNEDTGFPYFKSISSSEYLNLSELSSGEIQVVILLSYFAFLAKEGIPIVIDEPELSLHVQWQKLFVKAVKEVMPKECQTIMATHSPEICGAEDVNVQSISVRASK